MFQENLKAIRKEKGFTQESLAIELNVVRQTVSKWEKGLSVPDADMLQNIAEVLDVSVGRLLGAEVPEEEKEKSDIVDQLVKLNEQLAVKNRRSKKIWKGVITVLIIMIVIPAIVAVLAFIGRVNYRDSEPAGKVAYVCTLDGEEYGYEFEYNKNFLILAAGGDAFVSDHVDLQYDDVNQAVAHLKDWFTDHGGTVTVTEQTGLKVSE